MKEKQIVSEFGRVFNKETSDSYSGDREYDLTFLKYAEHLLTDMLLTRSKNGDYNRVLLEEAYNFLGFKQQPLCHCVGWLYSQINPYGDNHVDFNIDYDYLRSHPEEPIIVDFNIDGVIWNKYVKDGVICELQKLCL